jgi:ribonuclease HI
MHNTSSLFYRVFKSKYFPRCSILEAKLNGRGSLAWKSILGATQLIDKGLIWRVGSSQKIRIWEDKWLPMRDHNAILSPRPPQSPVTYVRQLIDEQSNTWKEGVVKSLFMPHEAEAILGIPLSSKHPSDTAVWGGTKNGVYSVRSGYYTLLNESYYDNPGPSNTSFEAKVWNTIWGLKIPAKIRHFLWRACHESLPTRINLHHRHVIQDPSCGNCNYWNETVLHALWQCNTLEEIWNSVPWGRRLVHNHYLNFMELFHHCHLDLSPSELQLFAFTTWSIWYRRNCQRLNQQPAPLNQLMPRAQHLLSEFQAAQESPSSTSGQSDPPTKVSWKPPQPGRYKANYDGAFFEDSNEAGIGVIIRNHRGAAMASLCQRIPFPHSVEAMEAYAARSAIELSNDLGLKEVDIEGDSQTIVNALCNPEPCNTLYGHLINDTKLIAQDSLSVLFLHVKRDGNVLAHSLAKRAKFSKPFEVWMESVPPDLISILCNDFIIQ